MYEVAIGIEEDKGVLDSSWDKRGKHIRQQLGLKRTRRLGSNLDERGQGEKAAVGIKKDRVFRREEINERY